MTRVSSGSGRTLVLVSVIAALLTVAGCGGSSPAPAAPGKAPAPQKVVFATVGPPSTFYVGHLAATKAGYLQKVADKYGFQISDQQFGAGPDVLAAMQAGEVTYSSFDSPQMLNAASKGQKIVGLMNSYTSTGFVVVAAKKWQASYGTDVKKFAKATWAFTKEGSATDTIGRIVAQSAGLKVEELNRIALGSHPAVVAGLIAGRTDIAVTTPSLAAPAIKAGDLYLIQNTNDPASGFPYYQTLNPYIFKIEFRDKYPEVTAALLAAEIQGMRDVQKAADNPSAVLALLPSTFDSKGFDDSWTLASYTVKGVSGVMTAKAVTVSIDYTKAVGVNLPADFDAKSHYDNGPLLKAYKSLNLPAPSTQ